MRNIGKRYLRFCGCSFSLVVDRPTRERRLQRAWSRTVHTVGLRRAGTRGKLWQVLE